MSKTGPCKAIVAFGMKGHAVVIATDNYWLGEEIENVTDGAEDVGLTADSNEMPGIYLFEGEGVWAIYTNSEGDKDSALEFDGTMRPVLPEELTALLAMKPEIGEPSWETDPGDIST